MAQNTIYPSSHNQQHHSFSIVKIKFSFHFFSFLHRFWYENEPPKIIQNAMQFIPTIGNKMQHTPILCWIFFLYFDQIHLFNVNVFWIKTQMRKKFKIKWKQMKRKDKTTTKYSPTTISSANGYHIFVLFKSKLHSIWVFGCCRLFFFFSFFRLEYNFGGWFFCSFQFINHLNFLRLFICYYLYRTIFSFLVFAFWIQWPDSFGVQRHLLLISPFYQHVRHNARLQNSGNFIYRM